MTDRNQRFYDTGHVPDFDKASILEVCSGTIQKGGVRIFTYDFRKETRTTGSTLV